jgi:hypothetical protein
LAGERVVEAFEHVVEVVRERLELVAAAAEPDPVVQAAGGGKPRRLVDVVERPQDPHVTGKAVDVGPTDAAYWLAQHGARYGLCQIYANEIWHFERVIEPGETCPEQLPDASRPS